MLAHLARAATSRPGMFVLVLIAVSICAHARRRSLGGGAPVLVATLGLACHVAVVVTAWAEEAPGWLPWLSALLVAELLWCLGPVEGSRDEGRLRRVAGELARHGDSVCSQNCTWAGDALRSESQLAWQRSQYLLAIEGVLLAVFIAGGHNRLREVSVAIAAAGVALGLVWVYFTRIGASQVRFWYRLQEIWHGAYMAASARSSGGNEDVREAENWVSAAARLREQPARADGLFGDCRPPWPGDHPWGRPSRLIELIAWIAVLGWATLACRVWWS